ncbi:MAG TPA: Uma2 family endonuclease, partial [Polyangiaceae bacterium]|nr:Uma2 family endonuclease [Polyangiaceae bacterium]
MQALDPTRRLATFDDLVRLGGDDRAEIHAGDIVVQPSRSPRHQRAARTLASHIGKPFDDDDGSGGPGGWWILLDI